MTRESMRKHTHSTINYESLTSFRACGGSNIPEQLWGYVKRMGFEWIHAEALLINIQGGYVLDIQVKSYLQIVPRHLHFSSASFETCNIG